MMQIVINKLGPTGLSPEAIAGTLRKQIIGLIPQDDITAAQALQRSSPFVVSQARTPMASAYHDLVRKLSGGILQKLKELSKPKMIQFSNKELSDTTGPKYQVLRCLPRKKR